MQERKPITSAVAGLIIAAVLIIYSIALQFLGLGMNRGMQWISYLLLCVGLIIFVNMYGKAKDNFVTFGNLFAYGFKATALAALVVIAFLVVFSFIFPEFKEKMMEASRTQMEEQDKMTDEQIDNALQMINRYYMVFMIGGTILFMAIFGAIGSLIGAAITKKKPFNPLDRGAV